VPGVLGSVDLRSMGNFQGLRERFLIPPFQGEGSESGERNQPLTGSSEPMPFGVFIAAQVPFGTFFHALPW
jgi:hypothetical protein